MKPNIGVTIPPDRPLSTAVPFIKSLVSGIYVRFYIASFPLIWRVAKHFPQWSKLLSYRWGQFVPWSDQWNYPTEKVCLLDRSGNDFVLELMDFYCGCPSIQLTIEKLFVRINLGNSSDIKLIQNIPIKLPICQ